MMLYWMRLMSHKLWRRCPRWMKMGVVQRPSPRRLHLLLTLAWCESRTFPVVACSLGVLISGAGEEITNRRCLSRKLNALPVKKSPRKSPRPSLAKVQFSGPSADGPVQPNIPYNEESNKALKKPSRHHNGPTGAPRPEKKK